MNLSWLCEQDPLWIVLILAAAMMLAAEVGYLMGRRWYPTAAAAAKDHFGAIRTSLLGLLALLLAFSFGMSAQRYETRRQLVMEDTILLRSLYLRSSLLADLQRIPFKKLLRQYVDLRSDPAHMQRSLTPQEVFEAVARSEEVYARMWELLKGIVQQEIPSKQADEMLKLLIDLSSVHNKRVQAYLSRVPDPIIWLLLGAAVTSMAAVGFSGGLNAHRGILARILLCLIVCGTVFVVLEMDRPDRGVLRVDQGPMIRLKQAVDGDPEAAA